MSNREPIATAWSGKAFVEIISINSGRVLARDMRTGVEEDLLFNDIAPEDITVGDAQLSTFGEMVEQSDESTAWYMFAIFTHCTGWADVVRAQWQGMR